MGKMTGLKNYQWMTVLLVSLTTVTASAQEASSPYSFSGPCASQGAWTRAALSHTGELKQIITNLKDNPACNALKASISSGLQGVDKYLLEIDEANEASSGKTQSVLKLPQEIGALRAFSRENSVFKNDVIQLLLGKTMTQSALESQRIDTKDGAEQVATSVRSLGQRSRRAAASGLMLFNSTMASIQESTAGCLDDTQGVSAFAGMVKVLASFASAGNQGMSTQMAMAVQNLGQYLSRDKKYVDALRKLDDQKYIASMSCLMEITTDGYCSALDAQYMFQEILKSQTIKVEEFTNKRTGQVEKKVVGMNTNFAKKLEQGPLAGYYILSRQVPIVTEWIQKVQYGITPQIPSEAGFKISVSTNVYEHNNTLTKIEGDFNFAKRTMRELVDFKSKQTTALDMLVLVAEAMAGAKNFVNTSNINFFSKVATTNEIYFRLVGMPIPEAVLGKGPEGMQFANNPEGWMRARYRSLPIFNDPEKLADIIYDNMQVLFKEASAYAISYYNTYFIVDKTQVVNDSLLGLDANVRDALVNIDRYLMNLTQRIQEDSKDPTMIASILDTRRRIGRILSRYKQLRDYGVKLMELSKTDPQYQTLDDADLDKQLRKIGDSLLQQVYTDFEILTARTGFLSKRMAGFVFQDYTISLRKRDEFNQYFEDLMLATGYNTLNNMMGMSQVEFSKFKTDLDQAMNIYKTGIDSLENIARDAFTRHIFERKLFSQNSDMTEFQRTQAVMKTTEAMAKAQIPGEKSNRVQRSVRGVLSSWWKDITGKDTEVLGGPGWSGKAAIWGEQIYNSILGYEGTKVVTPGIGDSAAATMAQYCVQTLAFANVRPYWALCQEATLQSPLMLGESKDDQTKKMVESYLSVNYVRKAYEHIEPEKKEITREDRARNYQARICALRDYHRRNEVARMTSAMHSDGDTYENAFTKEIKEDLVPKAAAPPESDQAQ